MTTGKSTDGKGMPNTQSRVQVLSHGHPRRWEVLSPSLRKTHFLELRPDFYKDAMCKYPLWSLQEPGSE